MKKTKGQLLSTEVRHIDMKQFDFSSLIEAMEGTAFQARNLGRAAKIYDQMLRDEQCGIILCGLTDQCRLKESNFRLT